MNLSSSDENAQNNSSSISNNTETRKTINFTSQDFENIDKLLSGKQESNMTKAENTLNENQSNYSGAEVKSESTLEQSSLVNQAQDFVFNQSPNDNASKDANKPNSKQAVGDVVMVNSIENIKKPNNGFYTNKYKEQLSLLKPV